MKQFLSNIILKLISYSLFYQMKRTLLKIKFTLKQFLPKTLLFRTLTILAVTLLILQLVLSIIFYDSNWRKLSNTLLENLSLTISEVVKEANNSNDMTEIENIINYYNQITSLKIQIYPTAPNLVSTAINNRSHQLIKSLNYLIPYNKIYINQSNRNHSVLSIAIKIQDNIYLTFNLKTDFFLLSSFYYLMGAFILLYILTIAIIWQFIRIQIRPLQQLAKFANKFAQDRKAPFIVPSGSIEIRETTKAFNHMTSQIQTFIDERTLMLSSISHDLKTSLTKMKLIVELKNNLQATNALQKEISNMELMLNSYLKFSQTDYPKLILKSENIKHFFNNIIEQENFAKLNISIAYNQTTKFFTINHESMQRVLENLLNNAQRFASIVKININDYSNYNIIITLDDNGKGIASNEIKDVFKPFYKVNTARTANQGSVGLGLYIAKDIISKHGGKINLTKSSLGGLQINIILPIN